ncbi:hypothetical protein M408DRAFT_331741 [Serendipita vermifera MAFF 305830]|uniref:Uncharacterized protein n=1 Tax=Serendipita vermifera MAFF 305830 TaxID=933852 RepID=A0A0C3AWZ1_SERVB|nr:hypothetical protein M408DRAFT_331741 [Serendipita vermifera MAFF 305830]
MDAPAPFVLPAELVGILETPGELSGDLALQARKLYSDASLNFHPPRDLSPFGISVFTGNFGEMKQVYERDHPDLNATETCFETGYISLAVLGSQRVESGPFPVEHAKVIVFLIFKGASVNVPDVVGSTAFHHLAGHNRVPKVLQVLFNGKPDPNARDRYGCTPAHNAVMHAQAEVLEKCLANGGDPDAEDAEGISPTNMVKDVPPAISAIVTKYKNKRSGMTESGKTA